MHEGLAALLAYRMSRIRADHLLDVVERLGLRAAVAARRRRWTRRSRRRSSSPENLVDDINASLNATEMARRQFREIARVAGLVFPGLPALGQDGAAAAGVERALLRRVHAIRPGQPAAGARRTARCSSASSNGAGSARRCSGCAASRVMVTDPKRFTPLAFPLLVDRTRNKLSSESLADRIEADAARAGAGGGMSERH